MARERESGAAPPVRFSFRYLDTRHPSFQVGGRDGEYFRLLLARFREVSGMTVAEFRWQRAGTLRIHPIDFDDPRVSVRGFGIPGQEDADLRGWQFALSANEHGRVHGFLVGETFYVRWLDPDQSVSGSELSFPGRMRTKAAPARAPFVVPG